MKKITQTIAILMLSSSFIKAQTQRIELIEEFTGESCGPCANANPAVTKLIHNNQNPKKVILLRYQTKIPSNPGPGSLYMDNSTEADARQSYYGIGGAPTGLLDGSYKGHIAKIDQVMIDANYLVDSPVSITAMHSMNNSRDSIFITVKVKAEQAFTPNGSMKLHCALTEEEIHFATAPGSNGEKDFEYTMRKMIPDADGTTMTAGAWTNGQTQSITLKAKIPTYIKDKTQIALVVFVQTEGNDKVLYGYPVLTY